MKDYFKTLRRYKTLEIIKRTSQIYKKWIKKIVIDNCRCVIFVDKELTFELIEEFNRQSVNAVVGRYPG